MMDAMDRMHQSCQLQALTLLGEAGLGKSRLLREFEALLSNEPGRCQLLTVPAQPDTTCFVNFYTNTSGAPAALPLPEAIYNEATAIFRRSVKQGDERFQWACRMKQGSEPCF